MQDPIYVAFATQKGGAGKSTLTTLVASYLHYVLGKRVLALDCDPRQHSMVEYRDKDKLLIRENPVVKRRFARFMEQFRGDAYGIVKCSPVTAEGTLKLVDGPVLVNNDRVLLESKTFRLNYTARSSEAHKPLIVIEDNFGSTPWEQTFEFNSKDSGDDGGDTPGIIGPVVGPVTPVIR